MIDFSTLQGLTIPEGVVSQIADASGGVIWEALRETLLILRPTGNCTLYTGSTEKYPADAVSDASLVGEEVADDDATYFSVPVSGDTNNSGKNAAQIAFADDVVLPKGSLVSVSFLVRAYAPDGSKIRNAFLRRTDTYDSFGYAMTSVTDSYEDLIVHLSEADIATMNEYISENHKLPPLEMYLDIYCIASPKGYDIKVTQIYLSLTFKG